MSLSNQFFKEPNPLLEAGLRSNLKTESRVIKFNQ